MEDSDMFHDIVSFKKSQPEDESARRKRNELLEGADEDYRYFISLIHEKSSEFVSCNKKPHLLTYSRRGKQPHTVRKIFMDAHVERSVAQPEVPSPKKVKLETPVPPRKMVKRESPVSSRQKGKLESRVPPSKKKISK